MEVLSMYRSITSLMGVAIATCVCVVIAALLFWRKTSELLIPGPADGEGRAHFRTYREDGFLRLTREYGRTLKYDGVVASSDPGVLRAVLLSRAHSVGRSIVYRLVANVMPYSDGILFSADDEWRRRHTLFTPLFAGGHIKKFTAHMLASACTVAALHAQTNTVDAPGDKSAPVHEAEERGAKLLQAALQEAGAEPLGSPLPQGDPVGSAGDVCGRDLLTAMRWTVLRVLLGWGLNLNADTHGTHPALQAKGYACACQPVKVLARCLDSYARLCFEVLPVAELSGRGWAFRWAREYARLWRVSRRLKAIVSDVVSLDGVLWARLTTAGPQAAGDLSGGLTNGSQHCGEEESVGVSPLSSCPVLTALNEHRKPPVMPLASPVPGDTFLTRMCAAGWSIDEITSEINHLHGAHKAAAFVACAGLTELSAREEVRQALIQELVGVCGHADESILHPLPRPIASPSEWLYPLIAHARSVASAGDGPAPAPATPSNGWRPPARSDLEEGRLPILRRVWKETLRHHVVSMGVMRKLGEPLTVSIAASGSTLEPVPVTLPAGSEMLLLLHGLHHDRGLWGPHAHWWLPERWDAASSYWEGMRKQSGGSNDASASLPTSYTTAFLPFLDGTRRCAGMYTAEMQFAVYAYAFTVLADVRATMPGRNVTSVAGGACIGGGTADQGLAVQDKDSPVLVGRRGALAWVHDPNAPPGYKMGTLEGTAALNRVPGRLVMVKRPDMFTSLDGHVPFTVQLR